VDTSADGTAEYVRDEPLTALAIAGVTGFVLGGGVNRRVGLELLAMVGRAALRAVAASLIVGIVTGDDERRPNRGHERARSGDGSDDDGRTDFQKPE
jgi:hypothetical protein